MPMPRQAEVAGQRLYSRRDVAKARIVDPWRHVQSLDDPTRARIARFAPLRSSQMSSRQRWQNGFILAIRGGSRFLSCQFLRPISDPSDWVRAWRLNGWGRQCSGNVLRTYMGEERSLLT